MKLDKEIVMRALWADDVDPYPDCICTFELDDAIIYSLDLFRGSEWTDQSYDRLAKYADSVNI